MFCEDGIGAVVWVVRIERNNKNFDGMEQNADLLGENVLALISLWEAGSKDSFLPIIGELPCFNVFWLNCGEWPELYVLVCLFS